MAMDIEHEIACLKLNVVAITPQRSPGRQEASHDIMGLPCHSPWLGQHRAPDRIYSGELCWQVWANPSIRKGPGRKGRDFQRAIQRTGKAFIGGFDDFGEERLRGKPVVGEDAGRCGAIYSETDKTRWHILASFFVPLRVVNSMATGINQ